MHCNNKVKGLKPRENLGIAVSDSACTENQSHKIWTVSRRANPFRLLGAICLRGVPVRLVLLPDLKYLSRYDEQQKCKNRLSAFFAKFNLYQLNCRIITYVPVFTLI